MLFKLAHIFSLGSLVVSCASQPPSSSETASTNQTLNGSSLQNAAPALKIKAGKGLLWMPFVWQVKLDSSTATKVGSLQMRSVNLVLFHNQKKQSLLFKLAKAASGKKLEAASKPPYVGQSNGVLDPREDELLYVNQHSLELDEGDYSVMAVRVGFVDPVSSKTIFNDFPVPNPFRPEASDADKATKAPPATVQIRSGKVSGAFRLIMNTTLKRVETPSPALSGASVAESIDRDIIPLGLVASQLGTSVSPEFFAASADIPRGRMPLVDSSFEPIFGGKTAAKAGVLVQYPCGMQNTLKLVWKKNTEEKEYEFPVELSSKTNSLKEKGESCYSTKYVTIPLTQDDWLLKSSHVVDTGAIPSFRSASLKVGAQDGVSKFLKTYFGLDSSPLLLPNTGNEKDFAKPFLIRIGKKTKLSMGQSQGVLFLGKFKLASNREPAKNQAQAWDLLFDRTYNLKDLRLGFQTEIIQNAYTLDELRRDKLLGQVNAILRASFAGSDKKSLESYQDEVRAGIAGEFKSCLLDRELTDPLVNATANLQFSALKGTQNLSVKKIEVDADMESGVWMRDCFEKKVLQFRLKKKIPANLQGEILVKTE
jgi:hypothetical protein